MSSSDRLFQSLAMFETKQVDITFDTLLVTAKTISPATRLTKAKHLQHLKKTLTESRNTTLKAIEIIGAFLNNLHDLVFLTKNAHLQFVSVECIESVDLEYLLQEVVSPVTAISTLNLCELPNTVDVAGCLSRALSLQDVAFIRKMTIISTEIERKGS